MVGLGRGAAPGVIASKSGVTALLSAFNPNRKVYSCFIIKRQRIREVGDRLYLSYQLVK